MDVKNAENIIKALEQCSSNTGCGGCMYRPPVVECAAGYTSCMDNLLKDATELLKDATELIRSLVAVVRCKDCELRNTEGCPASYYDSGYDLICNVNDYDFCSSGKLKDGCEVQNND